LLAQQQFDEAIGLYERALARDEGLQALLKPALLNYLSACLGQCPGGAFISLADSWLATYYDDIPVLLLLAEFQRQQGYPDEAAQVLQMARTYAYQPGQRERVTREVRRLVQTTDEDLSQQQRWIELLGFYELVETLELSEPEFQFRQATIYRLVGDPERSRSLLLALQANNERDPRREREIELELAQLTPAAGATAAPVNSIPLTRRGDHYLLSTVLNNDQQVTLIIDTGASITSLTQASFAKLDSNQFEYQGSRLFNTANGMTQGEVYKALSMTLGDTRIDGIDVAVLDFATTGGVDGLLGMNVLRNYRFEIDQEKALLYLQAR
jgi:clan AA aspartic protease (TIGR02281 family)